MMLWERRLAPRAAPRATEIGPTLRILGIPGIPGILFAWYPWYPWLCNIGASHPIESLDSVECAVAYRRAWLRPLHPVPALDITWNTRGLHPRSPSAPRGRHSLCPGTTSQRGGPIALCTRPDKVQGPGRGMRGVDGRWKHPQFWQSVRQLRVG